VKINLIITYLILNNVPLYLQVEEVKLREQ